jgi:hypothetical protein
MENKTAPATDLSAYLHAQAIRGGECAVRGEKARAFPTQSVGTKKARKAQIVRGVSSRELKFPLPRLKAGGSRPAAKKENGSGEVNSRSRK